MRADRQTDMLITIFRERNKYRGIPRGLVDIDGRRSLKMSNLWNYPRLPWKWELRMIFQKWKGIRMSLFPKIPDFVVDVLRIIGPLAVFAFKLKLLHRHGKLLCDLENFVHRQ